MSRTAVILGLAAGGGGLLWWFARRAEASRAARILSTTVPPPPAPKRTSKRKPKERRPSPRGAASVKAAAFPLPQLLVDGEFRKARISSQFKSHNSSRWDHDGVDIVYRRFTGDPDWPTGDGEGSTNLKWIVPAGTFVIATHDGIIESAGTSATGGYVWLEHDDVRAGYLHLSEVFVEEGQSVLAGQALGTVGDNPIDHDLRHLHFELSPAGVYRPMDPNPYLKGAPHYAFPIPTIE